MNTQELYKMVMDNVDTDVDVRINLKSLSQLVWFAQGIAVKQVCDRHASIMSDCHKKAETLRYHNMAASILPAENIIRDGRYGDAGEFADWSVRMTIPEEVAA